MLHVNGYFRPCKDQSCCKPLNSENEIGKALESIEATQFSFIHQINRHHQYLGENKNI